jgi:hypothetical protein
VFVTYSILLVASSGWAPELENQLDFAGLTFHQMRPQLRHDVHLFQRPPRRASFWPDFNPTWLEFDQPYQAEGILPKPEER